MKSAVSRKLVIDASVARASGGPDATHPSSKRCRDFLLKALEVCHRIIMTPDICAEWKKHQSRFAKSWLTSMVARRKYLYLQDCENAPLRQTVGNLKTIETDLTAMLKDVHLIEAALSGDRIIISLDDSVRGYFAKASTTCSTIKEVVWRNPARETALDVWLENGAKDDTAMKLGFIQKTK